MLCTSRRGGGGGGVVRIVVHIKDVAALYMLPVEDALHGGKRADWGANVSF